MLLIPCNMTGMIRFIFILACFTVLAAPASAQQSDRGHKLKDRIIRALAAEPGDTGHVLVGQKAKGAGSALVFKSLDGTESWRTQNGNAPLSPEATDVQAVAAVSADLLLAGTWKHGLYVSRDGGGSFIRVTGFPGADIRDLQVAGDSIYAATPRHGILVSTDEAKTWTPIGPNKEFFWSLSTYGDALYASSLESGVFRRRDGEWKKIFADDKASAFAAASHRRAVAGNSGLYIAEHGPWRQTLKGEKLADVLMPDNDTILAASWSNGIAVVAPGGRVRQRLLKGKAVVRLQIAGDRLLAGTWGDGLHIIPLSQIIRKRTPLIDAVVKNDIAAVAQLLRDGADPDGFDASRNTALIFAARDGQAEMANLLIDAGATPGWVDGEQVTPLILAAFRNHIDIVRLLLARKVDRDHRDRSGRTAKDYAAERSETDPVYRLLGE